MDKELLKKLEKKVNKAIGYYKNGDPVKDADITDTELVQYIIYLRNKK